MKYIKVKFTGFWTDDTTMYHVMMQFAKNQNIWKNLKIVQDDNYDRLIVFSSPFKDTVIKDLNRTILFLTEPTGSLHLNFNEVAPITPINFWLPTWSELSPDQYKTLMNYENIKKNNTISTVTSELFSTNPQYDGYFQRLRFVSYLDNILEDEIKVWGRKYSGAFFDKLKSYQGEIKNKYDALFGYQYHFACENSFWPNYFTEKIVDPILAECLCFYDGCTNLSSFIDDRAYIKLDLNHPQLSVERVLRALHDNEWASRLKYIQGQKKRLLTDLNPLNIVWMAVTEKDIEKKYLL